MRAAMLNTGTELLVGDVQDAHLPFIAREILPLGLRVTERRTVPDSDAIALALIELCSRCEILFVTGGLGPTSDDITREMVAAALGLELREDAQLLAALEQRVRLRGIKFRSGMARQAAVPSGAQVLANQVGSAPGFYLNAGINPRIASPHIFVLPGPPRELQAMFLECVVPILRSIAPATGLTRRLYKITGMGESAVEEAIGERVLALSGIELGYCARPGEVELRVIGKPEAIETADAIIRGQLGISIVSADEETLEQVVVKLLKKRNETMAAAESCTGGLIANRITNVPGASDVFIASYVTYANTAKIEALNVDPEEICQHGAVSEAVARAMAEGARKRAGTTYALAATGIAGPAGGSAEKPVGTIYIALAATDSSSRVQKFFFPTDRETFKQLAAQAALDLLRRKLLE